MEQYDSLGTRIFREIENRILRGDYAPGESLVETRLGEEFGVSRTPIREAVRQLEHTGLVEIVPNKGAVVVGITEQDLLDIYEMRIPLEGMAAAHAAGNISQENLARMQESVDLLDFYISRGDTEALSKTDSVFHEVIYHSCGSWILRNILMDFHNYVSRAKVRPFQDSAHAAAALSEHRAILDALEKKDSKKAQSLAEQHVRFAKKRITVRLTK
jgi:DNA-binding GntR family transcriptional regulator